MDRIKEITRKLDLIPHPEGGFYKETYRSDGVVQTTSLPKEYDGERNYSTCIYFLLTSETFSAFHKINQDEIWHFYEGSPILLHTIDENGLHEEHIIGSNILENELPQLIVPANNWFAASIINENSYALVGCTVSPGFDFSDFTLANRNALIEEFPQHENLISQYTRIQKKLQF